MDLIKSLAIVFLQTGLYVCVKDKTSSLLKLSYMKCGSGLKTNSICACFLVISKRKICIGVKKFKKIDYET